MEITLVVIVIGLWLAATGRLVNAWNVLTSAAPKPAASASSAGNTSNQTAAGVNVNTGWGPRDAMTFPAPAHQTHSNVYGQPIKSAPAAIEVIGSP
jgi:hypothetical protein